MLSLTFGLFTQVSDVEPYGILVLPHLRNQSDIDWTTVSKGR